MKYSFNLDMEGVVFAYKQGIDASYKQMSAVCSAIKYMRAEDALAYLDEVIEMRRAVPFLKYNKGMGSRSELSGRKGAYPIKAAKDVRVVLVNAMANARNKGMTDSDIVIVHASANKTRTERRYPSKGPISAVKGSYMGTVPIRHMDLQYSKVEIGLAMPETQGLSKNMKYFIRKKAAMRKPEKKEQKKPEKKKIDAKKAEAKKTEAKAPEKAKVTA